MRHQGAKLIKKMRRHSKVGNGFVKDQPGMAIVSERETVSPGEKIVYHINLKKIEYHINPKNVGVFFENERDGLSQLHKISNVTWK